MTFMYVPSISCDFEQKLSGTDTRDRVKKGKAILAQKYALVDSPVYIWC